MTTTTFDTLRYAKKLKEAGFTEKQAEVQAEALAEIVEERLATKQDIKELETKLEAKLDVRLAELKHDLIKWMLGIGVGVVVTNVSIIIALFKIIK